MKALKDIKTSEGGLNDSEKTDLNWLSEEITNIVTTNKINEEGLLRLENILISLINVKRTYTLRVIKLLKQNHMLD